MQTESRASLQRPEPEITPLSKPFWDHAQDQVLATPICTDCSKRHFPPGPICPHCLSKNVAWKPVSGRAELVSWVVFHQVYWDSVREEVPYLAAAVDLEEGVRLITNLVGPAAENPIHGMDLKVTFQSVNNGRRLPVFEAA